DPKMPNQRVAKSGSSGVVISRSQKLLVSLTRELRESRCSELPESRTSEVGEFETCGLPASRTCDHREIGRSDLPMFSVGNIPWGAAVACASRGPVSEGHRCGR